MKQLIGNLAKHVDTNHPSRKPNWMGHAACSVIEAVGERIREVELEKQRKQRKRRRLRASR